MHKVHERRVQSPATGSSNEDGRCHGSQAIPRLFFVDLIERGEVVELPLQPSPPSIVISMSRRADAPLFVHGAANAARAACHGYCELGDRRLIEHL